MLRAMNFLVWYTCLVKNVLDSNIKKGWCHECACEWLNTIYVEWYLVNFYNLDIIEVECFLQVRVSAVLTNGQYLLNLDCDHYINNSKALREAMCFLMDPNLGRSVCYVQFPQRFDGIDRNDRYANRNTVFFDVSLNRVVVFSINIKTIACTSFKVSN